MQSLQLIQKSVPLQCVFHSIRFKVNKGWSTAVLLFLCPYLNFTSLYTHSHSIDIQQINPSSIYFQVLFPSQYNAARYINIQPLPGAACPKEGLNPIGIPLPPSDNPLFLHQELKREQDSQYIHTQRQLLILTANQVYQHVAHQSQHDTV